MQDSLWATGLVAIAFGLVHILGRAMRFLEAAPRSIWLSLSGGVSLAYVFIHLLPELAGRQEEALDHLGRPDGGALGLHVYLTALAGLVAFHGLERLVRQSRRDVIQAGETAASRAIFWLHLGSYAVYNILIGYLLLHREDAGTWSLALYAVALVLHFVVNDQALRAHHGADYDRKGRWLLAAAPVAGWLAGLLIQLSPVAIATIFASLAGGIVLNVLKEELPEDRESRFWALALGALLFTALLLLAR